jgi:site-specific DNA-methyltransferase (adenine-specific)
VASWRIEQAEIVEWLRAYEGPRFHAVLSDPPYALISIAKRFGKEGSAPAQEGSDGRYSRLSGGFMGQRWDGFDSLDHYQAWVTEWANLLIEKALLPGAVALFFGGTRTFHRLGTGLELGGFEIIDCLTWLHGQGFPKSHNLAEHEGYGTALKPAWEPVFLCRAPRGSKTFAQLAVEYGTGALNVDGSRIAHGEPEERMYPRSSVYGKTAYANAKLSGERDGSEELASPNSLGRWPANLLLSHHLDCQKVGETQVKGRSINRFKQGMMPFGNAEGEEYDSEQMPDETVERWACVPECPIRLLDDQAGKRASGYAEILRAAPADTYSGGWPGGEREGATFGDSGGVSRFFYCSKASRAEKDLGLEEFYWKRTGTGFLRISPDDWEKLPKRERAQGCIHPTVKPLDLLRYLAKLVLPPPTPDGRRILVPFSGSGSEVIGAVQAGWDQAVAVEMEPIYNEMAEARIRATLGML